MFSNAKIHFEISERKILLRLFDVVSVLGLLYLLGIIFDFNYFKITQSNFYWVIILSLYLLFFGSVFEMYNLQTASNQFKITKSIVLTSSITVLSYLLTPFFTPSLPSNRLQIILFYFAVVVSLFVWRFIYLNFFASNRFFKKVLLVCNQDELLELVNGLGKIDPNYKIDGFINTDNTNLVLKKTQGVALVTLENAEIYIKENNISEIVIAAQKTDNITVTLYNTLLKLLESGLTIREYTQVYESITQRIPVQYVARDFYKYFPFSRSNNNKLYLVVMRFLEIIVSVLGLLFGFALLPFILIGNIFGNKGKLFYIQERVGQNGVVFNIYKLRSMITNAEESGAVFAATNDVRITPFGKFLRKSRLDEFPQFINVLKGNMAIIGPRPERPIFVEKIAETMPFYQTRHILKPGLTGWAQVNYAYGESIQDSLIKLQYDLYYIKHRSIFLDLNIVVKTCSTILFYRGQ